MRTFKDLSKAQQKRIRSYILDNPTVSCEELGKDLNIRTSTISAVRAHITRELVSRLEEAFSGKKEENVSNV
jgi:predicted transcriptional regulator